MTMRTVRHGRTSMKRALATLIAVVSFHGVAAETARAAQPQPAYRVSFELDAPLLLIAGSLTSSYFLLGEGAPAACAPLCDRATVNPIDRPFAGLHSERWGTVAELATASVLLLVPAGLLIGEPSRAGLVDLLILGEAAFLTLAIQVPVSYAVGRPRPRLYGEDAPLSERTDPNAARSFFSGHAGNCLAVTMVATVALRRIGRPRLAGAVLVVGLAGAALVGVARVAAGGHFPSDVVVGYAVGAGVGIAIPALHRHDLRASALAFPGAGISLSGRF
jgi:membrane-associated phospholipid phosphatase